jgi:hypothetical protein
MKHLDALTNGLPLAAMHAGLLGNLERKNNKTAMSGVVIAKLRRRAKLLFIG